MSRKRASPPELASRGRVSPPGKAPGPRPGAGARRHHASSPFRTCLNSASSNVRKPFAPLGQCSKPIDFSTVTDSSRMALAQNVYGSRNTGSAMPSCINKVLTPIGFGSVNNHLYSGWSFPSSASSLESMSFLIRPGTMLEVTEITPMPPCRCRDSWHCSSLPDQQATPLSLNNLIRSCPIHSFTPAKCSWPAISMMSSGLMSWLVLPGTL
mmetsp:Transcript_52104/g.158243  ORF Transcript_52104/g.158243 Transcript_52104/m.158243 type:complete len:211 (+) Transcript_52104:51-683(+)